MENPLLKKQSNVLEFKSPGQSPEERYIQLGWEILEHKWRYYVGTAYGVEPIPDRMYDIIEAEYVSLCVQLGHNEYSNAVGFPHSRASARLVDSKMRAKYGIKEKPFWE